jgi:hypothetical protein
VGCSTTTTVRPHEYFDPTGEVVFPPSPPLLVFLF